MPKNRNDQYRKRSAQEEIDETPSEAEWAALKSDLAKIAEKYLEESPTVGVSYAKDFPEADAAYHLQIALKFMRESRPTDRSPRARQVAVAITELEKVIAYWNYFLM